MIEMATGNPPWVHYDNAMTRMWKIAKQEEDIPIPQHLSPEAQDFIRSCLR